MQTPSKRHLPDTHSASPLHVGSIDRSEHVEPPSTTGTQKHDGEDGELPQGKTWGKGLQVDVGLQGVSGVVVSVVVVGAGVPAKAGLAKLCSAGAAQTMPAPAAAFRISARLDSSTKPPPPIRGGPSLCAISFS
jgi:hypothetical protein